MTTNDAYELVGGILHETPVDETNGLIDSPNFVAAKALVDKALSATSIADIRHVFKNVDKTLIDYINSPLIDVLSRCYYCHSDHISCIINNSCDKRYFGGIKYLYDKKLIDTPLQLLSIIKKTLAFAPYDDFVAIYEEIQKDLLLYQKLQLTNSAIISQRIDKFKYLWLQIKDDSNMTSDDIVELSRYNRDSTVLKLILDGTKQAKLSYIEHFIITGRYHGIEMLDILFTEHLKIGPISSYKIDSVIRRAMEDKDVSIIYYLHEVRNISIDQIANTSLYFRLGYYGCPSIIMILETLIAKSGSVYRINYDRILLDLLKNPNKYAPDEMLAYFINNRHKLVCELEYYALIALSSNNINVYNQFVDAGIDPNYNNGIYNKIRQIQPR